MTQRYAPDPVLSGFKLPNSLLKIQKGSQNDQDSTPLQRDVKQILNAGDSKSPAKTMNYLPNVVFYIIDLQTPFLHH